MSFDVDAAAYGRFMGRYAEPLAVQFAQFAGVRAGQRVLDVGCGPGALTAVLIDVLGVAAVSAIDPSPSFVAAASTRFPDADVVCGAAEALPYADNSFDAALAQLVVHFMADPVAGLGEMARVTRRGGIVAACVWDHAGGTGPISVLWRAATELDPDVRGEAQLAGSAEGQLAELCAAAGLRDIDSTKLTVRVRYETFEQWWEPYTLGVGPAGAYVSQLDDVRREQLRSRCRELLPQPPFDAAASTWAVTARA